MLALACFVPCGRSGRPPPSRPPSALPATALIALAPRSLAVQFNDPAFVQSVLGSLPGVDPSDPRIQSVLSSLDPKDEAKKEDGKGGDKK